MGVVILELLEFRDREIFLRAVSLSELHLVDGLLQLLFSLLLGLLFLGGLRGLGCLHVDCALVKKHFHHLFPVMLPGPVQRGMPLHISLINVRAMLNQVSHDVCVTLTRSVEQWCLLDVILLVDVRSAFTEQLADGQMPFSCGIEQRSL